jgi:hypothetical protein
VPASRQNANGYFAGGRRIDADISPPEYRAMMSGRRSGDLLPEHLVTQLGAEDRSTNGGQA